MVIILSVLVSLAFPLVYIARIQAIGSNYENHIINEKFYDIIVLLVESGNFSRLDKLLKNIDNQAAKLVKMMVDNRSKRADVEKIVLQYQQKSEANQQQLAKISIKSLVLHLVTVATLVGILYADGMQTGWVMGPITFASIVTLLAALLHFGLKKVIIEEWQESAERLPKLTDLLCQPRI